jgi:hypothetical protein
MADVNFYFLVTANSDGTFSTYPEVPKDLEAGHKATTYEMFTAMREIVQEMESSIMVDRIATRLAKILSPVQPTPADRVADALKERGIQPESQPASE